MWRYWPAVIMNIFIKALLWSVGFEMFLVLLVLGGCVGLPFLPYLALAFHFPALYLLDYLPAVRATWIAPILVQWLIWFVAFAILFVLRRRRLMRHSSHEKDAF